MPKAEELPEELKDSAGCNALDLRHASFGSDINKLIRSLQAPRRVENLKRICVGCGAGLLVALLPSLLLLFLLVQTGLPLIQVLGPLDQRGFEFGAFIFSGAAAAVLRQRGASRLIAVAISTILALFILAFQPAIPTNVLRAATPAFDGYHSLLLYLVIAVFYSLAIYGAFTLYDRTSSVFKSLLATGVALYSVAALLLGLLIALIVLLPGLQ